MDCTYLGCTTERVGGQLYCDDHLLEQQVRVTEAQSNDKAQASGGTLADLIRKAKAAGQIAPVSSGYQHVA